MFTDSAATTPVYSTTTQEFPAALPSTVYVDVTKTTTVTPANAPTYGVVPTNGTSESPA